jgi:putative membrane protein
MHQRFGFTTALLRVSVWMIPVGAYSLLTLWKQSPPFSYVPNIPDAMEYGLAFAMTLLIGFRVNRAYERWWEARTLWGQLVNVSRNLAVKISKFPQPSAEERKYSRDLIVAFAYGLKDHLRDEPELRRLPGFGDAQQQPQHMPSFLVGRIYEQLDGWNRDKRISGEELWVLDVEVRALLDVCGACERIKNTLPSISWRWFTVQAIVAFLLIFPWGLVDDFGRWTIPLAMAASYFIVGGEGIAQFVEEPFGHHEDHLDLDSMCSGIERSVSEILN